MQYLIARRDGVTRDELVANWFANHMPAVIAGQHTAAEQGRNHAFRYIATLFDPVGDEPQEWDGVAQLWWNDPLPRAAGPHGTEPRDTFQQKAEPYTGWPTTEYVILDGDIPFEPNTLSDPFPCTRSGFYKRTWLIRADASVSHDDLAAHWLEVHAPNVAGVMAAHGGVRYVVSLSDEPDVDPYVGMAEQWFTDEDAFAAYLAAFENDGFGDLIGGASGFVSTTEFVGIP